MSLDGSPVQSNSHSRAYSFNVKQKRNVRNQLLHCYYSMPLFFYILMLSILLHMIQFSRPQHLVFLMSPNIVYLACVLNTYITGIQNRFIIMTETQWTNLDARCTLLDELDTKCLDLLIYAFSDQVNINTCTTYIFHTCIAFFFICLIMS